MQLNIEKEMKNVNVPWNFTVHNYVYFVKEAEDKMSDLEMGMVNIITVFHKYSGHRGKLKKADLRALINNEMSNFIKVRFRTLNVNGYMFTE